MKKKNVEQKENDKKWKIKRWYCRTINIQHLVIVSVKVRITFKYMIVSVKYLMTFKR